MQHTTIIKQDLSKSASYTTRQKFWKGWAELMGQEVLETLNSANKHTTSHQARSFRKCILRHLLEFCKQQHTTSHQARSFEKFILHHLLRSYERDEQRLSVKSCRSSEFWEPSRSLQNAAYNQSSSKVLKKVYRTPLARKFQMGWATLIA